MSTTTKLIILKEIYFKHPTLTPIRGNPTYEDLQNLYLQAKANAKSIPIQLVRGSNSHLGIVISTTFYQTIAPNDPYVRPIHPRMIPNNVGTAAVMK